jgi:integrase
VSKFAFTIAALNKHFTSAQPGVVWDTTRGLGCYRNRDGSLSLFAQYRCGVKAKKRVLGRLTEISIADARSAATELLLNGRNGKDIVAEAKAKAAKALTLGDAYVAYMESLKKKGCSPNTIRLNSANWRHLSRLYDRELPAITRQDCRQLHQVLLERGPTLSNQVLRLLRTVVSYAMKRLDVPPMQNPVLGVEWAKERGERKSIPTSELAAFWKATGRVENPIRRAYWRFLLYSGARREEAASIRLADIDDTRVKLSQAKGGRFYTIAMTPPLALIIKEAREAGAVMHPKSPLLFPSSAKSGLIKNVFEPKALPGVSPHQMRRTYITAAIEAGINGYLVKSLVGHTQDRSDMTSLYLRISEEERMKAACKVADYISARISHTGDLVVEERRHKIWVVQHRGRLG